MSAPPISPDGRFWWDGSHWQSLYSADGRLKWDGRTWQPVSQPLPDSPPLVGGVPGEAGGAEGGSERPAHQLEGPAAGEPVPLEPAKALGGAIDWSGGVEPSKPVAAGIDWSRGVDPGSGDLVVVSGDVADRPQWLASGERYDERFLAPSAPGEAVPVPSQPILEPWNQVQGAQKSRVIPIVAAGVLAILAVAWVASSAGVTVGPPELPFLSREDSASAAPTPRPSPGLPAVPGRYPRSGERYALVVGADGSRLSAALVGVTAGCQPGLPVEQCRPAAQNALAAAQAYRSDLATVPMPACARSANGDLEAGLELYERGLTLMASADSSHPEQVAAGAAVFDLGSQRLIRYNRAIERIDPSTCS